MASPKQPVHNVDNKISSGSWQLSGYEAELVAKARNGDADALGSIFEIHYLYLYQLAWHYLKSKEIIEDMIQEIFIGLWVNRSTWNPQCNLRVYFAQCIKNKIYTYFRHKKKFLRLLDYLPDDDESILVEEQLPSDDVEYHEAMAILQKGIAALPKNCKRIFRLSREFDFSNQEIADIFNISIRTVESQISRAIIKLRKYYRKRCG